MQRQATSDEFEAHPPLERLNLSPLMWGRTLLQAVLALVLGVGISNARTWSIPADAPTIQAGIDSAAAGDDLLVAPGVYLEHDISMKAGVWVRSEQGPENTTVDAGGVGVGFDCSDFVETAIIEGFTIRNGEAAGTDQQGQSGGGVRCVSSTVEVRDCWISECNAGFYGFGWGGGIAAYSSDIVVTNCRIDQCSAFIGGGISTEESTVLVSDCEITGNVSSYTGGLQALTSDIAVLRVVLSANTAYGGNGGGILFAQSSFRIEECVVVYNSCRDIGTGDGIAVYGGSGSVSRSTVAYNFGWDPAANGVYIYDSDVLVEQTVIAFNQGTAFGCHGFPRVRCCDLYGNDGNGLCGEDLGGNFSADPFFCDTENGDFTLEASSPCLPGNHPDGIECGLIGALEQGCGAVPVHETTLGRIKSLFRTQ